MAYCLQCGRPFPAWEKAPDASTDATVAMNSVPPTQFVAPSSTEAYKLKPSPYPPPPPQRKSRLGWILGGAGAFVVLMGILGIVLVGGYLYMSRTRMQEFPPQPPNNNYNSDVRLFTNSNSGTNTNRGVPTSSPDAPSFSPPTVPTKTGSFTIYANTGWQLSDLETVGSEEFTTRATGLVDLAELKSNVGPKGLTDAASKSRRLIADFPTGALLMRTRYADGKFSNVQPVSAAPSNGNWQNFPEERGRLEFCVNDNVPQSNGGQFTVTLKMTKAPKPKN